jgi:hypothetical protein
VNISDTNIIIGFSRPSRFNPISSAIREVERTPYSHNYVRFYSASIDRWLVYHASHTSLHFLSWETFQKQNKILEEWEVTGTALQKVEALQFCVDNAGLPYGVLEIVGMGIIRLAKAWFDIRMNNPLSGVVKSQVCSEVALRVLAIYSLDIKEEWFKNEGPRKVREVLKNSAATRINGSI